MTLSCTEHSAHCSTWGHLKQTNVIQSRVASHIPAILWALGGLSCMLPWKPVLLEFIIFPHEWGADICFSGKSTDGQSFVPVRGAPDVTSDPLRDPPQCFRMLGKYFDAEAHLMILSNPPSINHHHQSHLWNTVAGQWQLAPPPPLF